MRRTSTAATLLAVAAALTLPSASPAAPGARTIKISSQKTILNVGAFRPSPSGDPYVRAAFAAFGAPSSVAGTSSGAGCDYRWYGLGLRISFANFGAPDRSACEADIGRAQVIRIGGSEAKGWHTNRGLYIRAKRSTMHRKYNAHRTGRGRYRLLGTESQFAPGVTQEVLGARISNGRVSSFILTPLSAGD